MCFNLDYNGTVIVAIVCLKGSNYFLHMLDTVRRAEKWFGKNKSHPRIKDAQKGVR